MHLTNLTKDEYPVYLHYTIKFQLKSQLTYLKSLGIGNNENVH